ncbi:hypothetical protein LX83_006735 [Goodfellowiella coeruleoviolacea]|uniref:DUF5753 domain-containing protein n=2 Tax=Goodfellowiella coeruleoviolacea TaxID=334858 RepID=A0AAE3KKY5_9PSEU|nr:hypothetical protein [Goodfellowiella coeruleoviolacea]
MILGALGVTTADRDRILDLAEDAKDATWLETSIPGVHRQLLALIEFERTARLITEVSPLLIPGLLQTGDYARAIMTGAGHRGHEAESRVMVRLGRKEILVRRKPVELVALIGEQAIRQPLGGPDVMAEQLHHLSEMAQRPNITIQVIPATGSIWHPGLTGPFTLLEFPLAPPMVNLEHHRSSLFLFESDDVSVYKDVVGTVRSIAMSPEESAKLIIDSKDKMEKA